MKNVLSHRLFQVMNVESSSLLLRPAEFYQQYGIEVWTNKEVRCKASPLNVFVSNKTVWAGLQVVSVNPGNKVVQMNDGALQHYDQLLISTGCRWGSSPAASLLIPFTDKHFDVQSFPTNVIYIFIKRMFSLFRWQSAAAQLSRFWLEGRAFAAELWRRQRDSQLWHQAESCCDWSIVYRLFYVSSIGYLNASIGTPLKYDAITLWACLLLKLQV